MKLVRLDRKTFALLEQNWRGQCDAYSENFEEFAPIQRGHARDIIDGDDGGGSYGIWALENEGVFEAFMHLNCARLPSTIGMTLRAVWILLSPEFDFADTSPDRMSDISSSIINECLKLSDSELNAQHVKIYIANISDRQFFEKLARFMAGLRYFSDVRPRGNWFHITKAINENQN